MCPHVLDDPDLRVTCNGKKKTCPTVKFDPVSGKINIKSISQIYKEKSDILSQLIKNKNSRNVSLLRLLQPAKLKGKGSYATVTSRHIYLPNITTFVLSMGKKREQSTTIYKKAKEKHQPNCVENSVCLKTDDRKCPCCW